ncbi:hypothetical protein HED60_14950 [Planctomycetales bacterium ZRK34]|nr:hypothetical protein HED60_14950 [Planctomycetales bacterium ZRK34]
MLAGRRRGAIMQGDCLVDGRQIPDGTVDAVIVDPPFGIRYRGQNNRQRALLNDEQPFVWFLPEAYRVLRPGGSLICFCQWRVMEDFRRPIQLAGFRIMNCLIWDKGHGGMGHTGCQFAPRHEVAWFAIKGRFRFPGRRPADVLPHRIVPPKRRIHSTQKPLSLMTDLIDSVTKPDELIYDPCCGSGSTVVAAVATGRRAIGMDLDAEHVAAARHRLKHEAANKASDQSVE